MASGARVSVITACWSRASSSGTAAGSRGGIYRASSGRGRRCGNGTRRFAGDGTWDGALAVLLSEADSRGLVDWNVSVDSTVNRAHQHGTNLTRPPQSTGGCIELHEFAGGAG